MISKWYISVDVLATRLTHDGSYQLNFSLPFAAIVYGDPHFVTLDGYSYTFNGKGEFTLFEVDGGTTFTLQGRMTEVTSRTGYSTVTVLSALVAKQQDSDTIQFDMSRRGVDVFVNGERMVMNMGSEVPAWNVVISRTGERKYMVHFSYGIHIEVEKDLNCPSVIVSIPESFMNRTVGLLGYYNGDKMDDLLPASGLDSLPLDSDRFAIHERFGLFCECMILRTMV